METYSRFDKISSQLIENWANANSRNCRLFFEQLFSQGFFLDPWKWKYLDYCSLLWKNISNQSYKNTKVPKYKEIHKVFYQRFIIIFELDTPNILARLNSRQYTWRWDNRAETGENKSMTSFGTNICWLTFISVHICQRVPNFLSTNIFLSVKKLLIELYDLIYFIIPFLPSLFSIVSGHTWLWIYQLHVTLT